MTRARTKRCVAAALVLSVAAVAACTPALTPPPKPPPSTQGPNPDLAPDAGEARYAAPGPYAAGVRTIEIEPGRKAEVWYPAPLDSAAGKPRDVYRVKSFLSPFMASLLPAWIDPTFETPAYRDLPVATGATYPLVLFSHGASSYRLQSSSLTAHLATWGFVVVSPDYFERGLQGLLGVPPAPAHDDWFTAGLAIDAARAASTSGFLAGTLDQTRVFPIGHSAGGGTSMRLAALRSDVPSFISLAAGYRPTSSPLPAALADPNKPGMFIGGVWDNVAPLGSILDAYAYTAGPRKLVVVPKSGHNNAFTDICEIARDQGGVVGLAYTAGLPVPDFVANLGRDGCISPPHALGPEVWPIVRHFVVAELRYRSGLDPEPVGLGSAVVSQFGALTPTYEHSP